ncbi:MAG: VOC family protein, partial [Acidimicrobiales bacterium]
DVKLSLEFYGRLGFATREYDRGGDGYVTRDGIELHGGVVPDGSNAGPASAYLWVEDADIVARTWSAAGADVRLPEDTAWGQHEGVLIDPDGNIIRFGSPAEDEDTGHEPRIQDGGQRPTA